MPNVIVDVIVVTGGLASFPGLRSGKLGEQCEAVVLFPKLFQKYPFPILINSAFLKLADIFRLGYGRFRNWSLVARPFFRYN